MPPKKAKPKTPKKGTEQKKAQAEDPAPADPVAMAQEEGEGAPLFSADLVDGIQGLHKEGEEPTQATEASDATNAPAAEEKVATAEEEDGKDGDGDGDGDGKDKKAGKRQKRKNENFQRPRQRLKAMHEAMMSTHVEECPSRLVGKLIGKGGENIKQIQAVTGVQIHVEKAEEAEKAGKETRSITIKGFLVPVANAVSIVQHHIRVMEIQSAPAKKAAEAESEVVTHTLEAPKARVATIIGKQGVTIKAIKVLSECKIEVEKSPPEDQEMVTVTIKGLQDGVTTATDAITALIQMESREAYAYAEQIAMAAAQRQAYDYEQAMLAEQERAAKQYAAMMGMPDPTATSDDAQAKDQGKEEVAQDGANEKAGKVESDTTPDGWKQMIAKHPDGTDLRYFVHSASGQMSWTLPDPRMQHGWM